MPTIKISEAEIRELNYERFQHPSPIVQKSTNQVIKIKTELNSLSTLNFLCLISFNNAQ